MSNPMTQTYMPDSARQAMPNNAFQPLPPYLQPHFEQSLDKSRPAELVVQLDSKGKPKDPSRQGNLTYRYLDTGELTLVPNVWYNQTREMRVSWWIFEASRVAQSLKAVEAQLAEAKACKDSHYQGQRTEKVVQSLEWAVSERRALLAQVQQTLENVKTGADFK